MRPIFIGGCGRSGTTLLAAMLGAAPESLAIPEMKIKTNLINGSRRDLARDWRFRVNWEMNLAPVEISGDSRAGIEQLVRAYGERVGLSEPDVWIDHTPNNLFYATRLKSVFPDARMVHIVRDGRGVAASMMKSDFGPNEIPRAAHNWMEKVGVGMASETSTSVQAVRVRYEDLVLEPETTLRYVCTALGLQFDPRMARADGFKPPRYSRTTHALIGKTPDTSRIDSWKEFLTQRQIEVFEHLTGDFLEMLGYELVFGGQTHPLRSRERVLLYAKDVFKARVSNRIRWKARRRTTKQMG